MTKKGFTLVELMVTFSIISVLSVVVFANYRLGEKQFALQRSAYKLAQDIRRAQEMAMSAKEFSGAPATFKSSYGINFQINSTSSLFADLNEDKNYSSNEKVETLESEKGVGIISLSPCNPLTVVFSPPDPDIIICGNPAISSASITLNFAGGAGKTIKVNKAGLIEIE